MTTVTPAAAYWTAVLAETTDSDRAAAIAALLASGTKIKLYDSGGSLLRTVTTDAWSAGSVSSNAYPITPGAFTDGGTGTGTPALAVFTTSDDTELFRCSAGVLSGVFQVASALASGVALTAGSFVLNYPTSDASTPSGKRWYPGHYMMATDDTNRTGILESSRNLVKTDPNWKGYYCHYWWNRLESTQGTYDFSSILTDLDKAAADGKKVWIMPHNRSFHGASARGGFAPAYIVNAGWTYEHAGNGQTIAACKLWVPGCGEAWLDFIAALCEAVRDHEALQGITTEESVQEGAYLESGWTYQLMNAFLLEQSRVGAENIGDALWHNNMAWPNESMSDLTEHYRVTDTMVRTHRAGLAPNDLRLSTNSATLSTTYGSYCFTRYAGEAYFLSSVEWPTFFMPDRPKALLDFAVDTLGMQFIMWQPVLAGSATGLTFTFSDVQAEVTRQSGRIATARPINAAV